MNFTLASNPGFSPDTCNFFGCEKGLGVLQYNSTQWDIINPILLFMQVDTMCQYANVTVCCTLDPEKNPLFLFLRPFCIDLLPFCIFYSFIKIIVSVVNYVFVYKKRIENRLKKSRDALLNDRVSPSKQNYFSFFQSFLKTSFILDIVSGVFSLWVFKGYQYYASQYSVDPDAEFSLLGNYNSPEDLVAVIILFISVVIWFLLECWKTYIQIFSVSSLTHLDNLKKETERQQEKKFYGKHRKFALWWTAVLFIVGMTLLVPNFFWKVWVGDNNFRDFKLYYKYFSPSTVSFWLSYALISILILTDRILAYDGFKQRQAFREDEKKKMAASNVNYVENRPSKGPIINLQNYQVTYNSNLYNNLEQIVKRKFPNKNPGQVEDITKNITRIYNEKMKDHFESLNKKIDFGEGEETMTIETSMSYATFLRMFNVLSLIGYTLILFSYQQDSRLPNLPLYLFGFIISSCSTFAFELTHNYLLYRSYFLQILTKMNKIDDARSNK